MKTMFENQTWKNAYKIYKEYQDYINNSYKSIYNNPIGKQAKDINRYFAERKLTANKHVEKCSIPYN